MKRGLDSESALIFFGLFFLHMIFECGYTLHIEALRSKLGMVHTAVCSMANTIMGIQYDHGYSVGEVLRLDV